LHSRFAMPCFTCCLLGVILAPCPGAPAQAETRWPDERAAAPFVLHADFSLDEHLGLVQETARLQQDLQDTLGLQPSDEPIHLLLFERKSTYQKYLGLHFKDLPFRRAMFIKTDGPGMVFAYQNADFDEDVRHECTHALLHSALPMVPLWLDEGLAEYFEVPPEQRVARHPYLGRVRWMIRLRGTPQLETLEELDSIHQMQQADYRDAWAWVHFMIHGPPAAQQVLREYLADVQAHKPPEKISTRLRRSIPRLDDQVSDHFIHWKP